MPITVDDLFKKAREPDARLLTEEERATLCISQEILCQRQLENTCLLEAIVQGKDDYAEQLITLAIELESPLLSMADTTEFNQNTPLLLAIKKGNTRLALRLIRSLDKLSLDKVDANGFAAIHHAAIMRNNTVLQALAEKGADLSVRVGSEQVSAFDLYQREITEDNLAYPLGLSPRVGSHSAAYFTKNPLYTDLHWHILDIYRNQQREPDYRAVLVPRRIRVLANQVSVTPIEIYRSQSCHENPYVRVALKQFIPWRNGIAIDARIHTSLLQGHRCLPVVVETDAARVLLAGPAGGGGAAAAAAGAGASDDWDSSCVEESKEEEVGSRLLSLMSEMVRRASAKQKKRLADFYVRFKRSLTDSQRNENLKAFIVTLAAENLPQASMASTFWASMPLISDFLGRLGSGELKVVGRLLGMSGDVGTDSAPQIIEALAAFQASEKGPKPLG